MASHIGRTPPPPRPASGRIVAFVGGLVRLWRRGNRARRYAKQMPARDAPMRPGSRPVDAPRREVGSAPCPPVQSEDRLPDGP